MREKFRGFSSSRYQNKGEKNGRANCILINNSSKTIQDVWDASAVKSLSAVRILREQEAKRQECVYGSVKKKWRRSWKS
jgi:hypothetical protein